MAVIDKQHKDISNPMTRKYIIPRFMALSYTILDILSRIALK